MDVLWMMIFMHKHHDDVGNEWDLYKSLGFMVKKAAEMVPPKETA